MTRQDAGRQIADVGAPIAQVNAITIDLAQLIPTYPAGATQGSVLPTTRLELNVIGFQRHLA